MDASLWVAKTGLNAQQTRMSVIANNLANVNTTGFKRDRPVFEDLLYQNIRQPGASADAQTVSPPGLMMGTGSRIIATEKIHEQGNMMEANVKSNHIHIKNSSAAESRCMAKQY